MQCETTQGNVYKNRDLHLLSCNLPEYLWELKELSLMNSNITLKFVMLRGLLNQTISCFSSPGEGFSGLPHEVDYAAPRFITRACFWQAGKRQLSTELLAEDEKWSGF